MFFGTKPFLIISDADLLKDITVKHFDKFANRMVSNYIYLGKGVSWGGGGGGGGGLTARYYHSILSTNLFLWTEVEGTCFLLSLVSNVRAYCIILGIYLFMCICELCTIRFV